MFQTDPGFNLPYKQNISLPYKLARTLQTLLGSQYKHYALKNETLISSCIACLPTLKQLEWIFCSLVFIGGMLQISYYKAFNNSVQWQIVPSRKQVPQVTMNTLISLPFHNDDLIDQAWKHNQRGTWLRFPAIMNSIVGLGRLLSSSFIPSSIQQVFNSTSIFAKSCASVQQGDGFLT